MQAFCRPQRAKHVCFVQVLRFAWAVCLLRAKLGGRHCCILTMNDRKCTLARGVDNAALSAGSGYCERLLKAQYCCLTTGIAASALSELLLGAAYKSSYLLLVKLVAAYLTIGWWLIRRKSIPIGPSFVWIHIKFICSLLYFIHVFTRNWIDVVVATSKFRLDTNVDSTVSTPFTDGCISVNDLWQCG